MSLRHLSAVKTLNGKSAWRLRKWRFSVTSTSAPAHSVYAAMKASADFRPLCSYLKAISKGTTMSSSIVVSALINSLNSWKASAERLRFTSSNMVRGMRMVWMETFVNSLSKRFLAVNSFKGPNANIYSFESMMSRKFLLPDGFSGFSESFYNLILTHFKNGRRIFGDYFFEFIKMFFGLGRFFIHCLSPQFKVYYGNILMSRGLAVLSMTYGINPLGFHQENSLKAGFQRAGAQPHRFRNSPFRVIKL